MLGGEPTQTNAQRSMLSGGASHNSAGIQSERSYRMAAQRMHSGADVADPFEIPLEGGIPLRWGGGGQTVSPSRPPSSAFQRDLLQKDLRLQERFGSESSKQLENGRLRYYGNIDPASKPGEMAGRRVVRELNPESGQVRTWHETVDHSGNVRQIRPQADGPKVHYQFDALGNYLGDW